MAEIESGQVVAVSGDSLKISMARKEACAKCRACVAGFSEQEMILNAENKCGAKFGDVVEIELDPGIFLRSAVIVYGTPLVCMFIGFFIGMALTNIFIYINSELLGFLVGMCFMSGSYILIRRYEGKLKKSDFSPKAVKIVTSFNKTE